MIKDDEKNDKKYIKKNKFHKNFRTFWLKKGMNFFIAVLDRTKKEHVLGSFQAKNEKR